MAPLRLDIVFGNRQQNAGVIARILAADREAPHQRAVHPDLDLVLVVEAAYGVALLLTLHADAKGVFAVQRKRMPDRKSAARPERHVLAHAAVLPPEL